MLKIGVFGVDVTKLDDFIAFQSKQQQFELVGVHSSFPIIDLSDSFTKIHFYEEADELLQIADCLFLYASEFIRFDFISNALRHFKHIWLSDLQTLSVEEVQQLVKIANEAEVVISIQKRMLFHPLICPLQNTLHKPQWIRYRHAFSSQISDTDLIENLLPESILFLQQLIRSKAKSISCTEQLFSASRLLELSVRIEYDNGCIASVHFSSIEQEDNHQLDIYQQNERFTIDFTHHESRCYHSTLPENGWIILQKGQKGDEIMAIQNDFSDFYRQIAYRKSSVVSLSDSLNAIHLIREVRKRISTFSLGFSN